MNDFRNCINKLEELYTIRPDRAIFLANSLKRDITKSKETDTKKESKYEKNKQNNREMFIMILIYMVGMIYALIRSITFGDGFFVVAIIMGSFCFISGFYFGMYTYIIGIYFLFLIGGAGIGLIFSVISPLEGGYPLLNDYMFGYSDLIKICYYLCGLGSIPIILFNLSKKIKKIKLFKYLGISIISLSIIIAYTPIETVGKIINLFL